MQRLRTIPQFVRWLVVLFLAAQFAGVVSSPPANAQTMPAPAASHVHHRHAYEKDNQRTPHHHDGLCKDCTDYCCALHAFFAGILPPVIAVDTADIVGQRLASSLEDFSFGIAPDRLDRPPRPHAAV